MLLIGGFYRRGFDKQLLAGQIAMHNHGLEGGLVGHGLVLRRSRGANDACRDGRVVQELGKLRAVRDNVVGRLNGGIGAVVVGDGGKGDLRRAARDLRGAQMKCGGRGIEFRFKIVRERLERSVHDAGHRCKRAFRSIA